MTVLRKIIYMLLSMLALSITALLICVVFAIPITLAPLHGFIESSVAKALSREVTIAEIEIIAALQPEVRLTDMHIGNPRGWQSKEDFIQIAQAEIKFDLLSLLNGKLDLQWLHGEGLTLLLAHDLSNTPNWQLPTTDKAAANTTQLQLNRPGDIQLSQVVIRYQHAEDTTPALDLQLDELSASAVADESLKLQLAGRCQQQACNLTAQLDHSSTGFRLQQLQGNFGEINLGGQVTLGLNESRQVLTLGAQLDISALNAALVQIWQPDLKLDGLIKGITLRATGQGADFTELLDNLDLALQTTSSRLNLARQKKPALTIELGRTELKSTPGQPLQGSIAGTLHGLPLTLNFTSDITQLLQQTDTEALALPVQLAAKVGENEVHVNGHISKPAAQLELDLQIETNGPHISELLVLFSDISAPTLPYQLRIDAPALPYRLRTKLLYTQVEIRLSELDADIGPSSFNGELALSAIGTTQQQLRIKLHSPVLNLAGTAATATAATAPESIAPVDKISTDQARETETLLGLDRQQGRQVQTALTRLGFDTQGADGIFGPRTRKAIRAFQNSYQQQPSGYLTAEQLAILLDDKPPPQPENAIPANKLSLEQARETETLLGLDRRQGRQVQTALTRLGFDTQGADGIFGPRTRKAIRAFQNSYQQQPSGYLTAEQLAILLDDKPPPQLATGTLSILDQPLPTGLELIDGKLELSVERLLLAHDTEISKFSITGQLDNGHLAKSSFQATLGKHNLSGTLQLDFRAQPSQAQLSLAAEQLDIDKLLRELQIETGIGLSAAQFDATLTSQGTTLRELMFQSSVDATLSNGRWIIGPDNSLHIITGRLKAEPKQPVTLNGEAQFRDTPLKLTLRGETLAAMINNDSWRLNVDIKSTDNEQSFSGTTRLPVKRKQFEIVSKLTGKRLDKFGDLFDITLPPIGPYKAEGKLHISKTGYQLQDLQIQIGDSDVRGQLQLAMNKSIPSLTINLEANQLQLEDFGLDLFTQTEATQSESDERIDSLVDLIVRSQGGWIKPEPLPQIDARFTLEAGQVGLGKNAIYAGPLSVAGSVQDGRFTLQRWQLGLGGGTLGLRLMLQPEANSLVTELALDVDQLDYGAIAQMFEPDTKMRGHLYLDSKLHARIPDLDTFMDNANGHINFLLQPYALEAGPLALWELNLLTLLLPILDSSDSKINCVLGQFTVDDGVLKISPGSLILDTSKIRASAEGEVNFKTQHVNLTLIPKVKAPGILDLATPVRVSGDFSDFGASIAPGGLIQTAAKLSLGLNRIWLNIFNWEKPPPADGSDICYKAALEKPINTQAEG